MPHKPNILMDFKVLPTVYFSYYRYIYTKKYGKEPYAYDSDKFCNCIKICLGDSVKHHMAIHR